MNRRIALGVCAAPAAALALPRRARAADPLRIAGLPSDPGLEASYAESRGIPARFGIAAQVQNLSNGAAIVSGILGGSIDLGEVNWVSALQAHERGLPLVAVAQAGTYASREATTFLMVPNGSPARAARDLDGKTIAVDGLRNLTQLGVIAWLDENGGDSKSVKFVEIPFTDMPVALAGRRIDAALITEPMALRAQRDARVIGKPYDAIAPDFPSSAWVASSAWASANPDLARRFANMMYRSAAWINRNRAATAVVLAEISRLEPEVIRAMPRARFAERNDPRLLRPLIDRCLKYGLITKPVEPGDLFAPAVRAL